MPLLILNYLSILTLWKGAIENTARFMAVLLGLHDNWSTYYAGWCLQCSLYALNLMLNGKSHSLEILITRQSSYIFACTKQKIYTDICLTSCCPLHTHPLLTFLGTILFKAATVVVAPARSRAAKQPGPLSHGDGIAGRAWKEVCPINKNYLLHNSSNQSAAVQRIWQTPSAFAMLKGHRFAGRGVVDSHECLYFNQCLIRWLN